MQNNKPSGGEYGYFLEVHNGTLHFLFNCCSNWVLGHAFIQSFLEVTEMDSAGNHECPRKEPGYSFVTHASCFAKPCGPSIHAMLKIIP